MLQTRPRIRLRARTSGRSRMVRPLVAAVVAVLAVPVLAGGAGAGTESLTVGSKDFAGAQALSQAYGQALEAKDFDISFEDNIGPTEVVYPALENGDLDAYADYQGTLLTYLGGTPTGDSATTYKALQAKLKGTGIVASKPAPAVDVNGFYVTKATAKKYKLKTLSDLAKVSDELSFGGPPECEERPLCLGTTSQELYGFEFSDVKKLDIGRPDHRPGARGRRHRRRAAVHRQQRHPEGRGPAEGRQGPPARRQPGVPHARGQGDARPRSRWSTASRPSSPPPPTTRCRSPSARTRRTRPTRPPTSWTTATSPDRGGTFSVVLSFIYHERVTTPDPHDVAATRLPRRRPAVHAQPRSAHRGVGAGRRADDDRGDRGARRAPRGVDRLPQPGRVRGGGGGAPHRHHRRTRRATSSTRRSPSVTTTTSCARAAVSCVTSPCPIHSSRSWSGRCGAPPGPTGSTPNTTASTWSAAANPAAERRAGGRYPPRHDEAHRGASVPRCRPARGGA